MLTPGATAFDAATVAPAVRLRAWADVTSRLLLPLQIWSRTGSVDGSIEEKAAGPVAVSRYAASPHFGFRSEAAIHAHPAPGLMKVAVVLGGSVTVRQGEVPVTLRVGESAAYATWLPYAVGSDAPFEVLIALLPADLVGVSSTTFEGTSARVLGRAETAPLRAWMLSACSATDRDRNLFGDKVHAAMQRSGPPTKERTDADRLFREALGLMHRRAGSRWLTPEYIAEVLGISRRTLYSAFASNTSRGVARTLRAIRLDHARDMLVRDHAASIREVGIQAGYDDPAHFTRAYLREFGRTPGRDRRAGHFVQSGSYAEADSPLA